MTLAFALGVLVALWLVLALVVVRHANGVHDLSGPTAQEYLAAHMENLQRELGAALLPAMNRMNEAFKKLGRSAEEFNKAWRR